MRPGRLEVRSALLVHKPRCSVGETAIGIGERLAPFGFEEEYPACAQPLEHVVDARAGADQLRLRRALQVGAAKRSEQRRVGKECVSTCRIRVAQCHSKKKKKTKKA